jgi:hypothetical protein
MSAACNAVAELRRKEWELALSGGVDSEEAFIAINGLTEILYRLKLIQCPGP